MEQNSYLKIIGEQVRKIRKDKKLNQVKFYNKIFKNNDKSEETIKKKMNKIENGKQKTIDFDFLTRICDTYNVSMDYLLGRKTDYKSYENDFICNFTGLSEKAVDTMRTWVINIDNAKDIKKEYGVYVGDDKNDIEDQMDRDMLKDAAINLQSIVNCLFEEDEIIDERTGKKRKHSNIAILKDLYRICMLEPKSLHGHFMKDDYYERFLFYKDKVPNLEKKLEWLNTDPNQLIVLMDSNDVAHSLDCKKYIEYISREYLEKDILLLIDYIKKKNIK